MNKLPYRIQKLLHPDSDHFNYRPIGEALQYDNNLILALRNLSIMSDCGEHSQNLLISHEESCLSGAEIIVRQFVRRAVEGNESLKKNLAEAMSEALKDAGFDQSQMEIVSSFFAPFGTVDDFLKQSRNSHLFKARGFSSFAAFSAAREEGISNIRKQGRGRGGRGRTKGPLKVNLTLSPKVLISLLKANPFIMDDSARYDFLRKLKEFSSAATAFLKNGNDDIASISAVNLTILKNCLFNTDIFLASEKVDRSLSLGDYCRGTEFPTRFLPHKELDAVMKTVTTSKHIYDLKNKNEKHFKVSYSCFKCPSNAGIKIDVDESVEVDFRLRNKVDAYANVNRLFPLDDIEAITKHIQEVHCVGGAKIAHLNNEHSHLIVCSLCHRNNVPDQRHLQVVCCFGHLDDHLRSIHYEELILLHIYNRLRRHFEDDSNAIKTLDFYLLSQCVICGNLFDDQMQRNVHQDSVCLPRILTLSIHYGEPLSTEIFRSTWSKKGRREVEQQHALKQLRHLTDSIVGIPSLGTLTTSVSVNDMLTNDPPRSFQEVIAIETDNFFFPSSSDLPQTSSVTEDDDPLSQMVAPSTSTSHPSYQEREKNHLFKKAATCVTIDSDEEEDENVERRVSDDELFCGLRSNISHGLSKKKTFDKTLTIPQYLSRKSNFRESSDGDEEEREEEKGKGRGGKFPRGNSLVTGYRSAQVDSSYSMTPQRLIDDSPSPPPYSHDGHKGKGCSKGRKKKEIVKQSNPIQRVVDIKPVFLRDDKEESSNKKIKRPDVKPTVFNSQTRHARASPTSITEYEDSNTLFPSIDDEESSIQEADQLYNDNFELVEAELVEAELVAAEEEDRRGDEEQDENRHEEHDESDEDPTTKKTPRKRAIIRSSSSSDGGGKCASESPSETNIAKANLILARYPHKLKNMRAAIIGVRNRFDKSS